MLLLYNAALYPVRAAVQVWSALQTRGATPTGEWAERAARALPRVAPGGIWVHGASVGEARIVRQLAGELRRRRPGLPLSVSCVTRTGRGQLPAPPDVDAAFFLPLDLPGIPRRVLTAVAPSVLVLVETELWPNLLHDAALCGIPVVLVNGRLSEEKMPRYRRFARLYAPLLAGIAKIGVQTIEEGERFVRIGARPAAIVVTGNVKYDLPAPVASAAALRARFGIAAGRPVLVAGSTGQGEDPIILEAFVEARNELPELFLVIVPRHPERAAAIADELTARELRFRRSSEPAANRAGDGTALLVDTVGELAGLYLLATAAFVGGTLVPIGGHNLVEPAVANAPVLFGPHTGHVAEMAELLEREGAALRVADGAALRSAVVELCRDSARRERMSAAARGVVERNRGALARSAELALTAAREGRSAA